MASGRIDDAQPHERPVDHAVALQQHLPGIDADQKRRPERQDHQHQQNELGAAPGAGDGVGDGVADEQTQQRGDEGDAQRRKVRQQIQLVLHQEPVVAQGDLQRQTVLGLG
jgi:hypothetical protein